MVEEVGEGGDHVREGRVVLEVLHEGEDCKTEEGALMDVVSYLAGAFEASDPPHGWELTIVMIRWKLRLCQNQ